MIICERCGSQTPDGDEFCGACGSFLEWSGEKVGEPEPEAIEPESRCGDT